MYIGEVLDVLLPLLKQQPFPISLTSLAEIERAVVDRFDAPSFHPLSRISFLDFLVSDAGCTAALGGSLNVGASGIDESGKKRVVEIVSQLRQTERNDKVAGTSVLVLRVHSAFLLAKRLSVHNFGLYITHNASLYLHSQKDTLNSHPSSKRRVKSLDVAKIIFSTSMHVDN